MVALNTHRHLETLWPDLGWNFLLLCRRSCVSFERNILSSPLQHTVQQLYLFCCTLYGISSEVNIDNLNLLDWVLEDCYLWVWYGFGMERSINLLYWEFFIRLTSSKPQQQTTQSRGPTQAAAALLNEKQNISIPCFLVYCFYTARMTQCNKIMIGCSTTTVSMHVEC